LDIHGLQVRTVSELLALRQTGGLHDEPVVLRGYWTFRFMHLCGLPMGRPGALELWCSDREFGITERREPILDFGEGGRRPATGASLTPFVDESTYRTNLVFALAASRFELRTEPEALVQPDHGLLAYAMVSRDAVTLPWSDDPSRAGHRARLALKLMCFGWSSEKVGVGTSAIRRSRSPCSHHPADENARFAPRRGIRTASCI
jgi:hypothetical protein